jgi:hypothetical protein
MTPDRDIERLLDRWLADGPTEVADRVIDQVGDRIARHSLRPAWRVSWRDTHVPAFFKPLAAVAAVVILAVFLYSRLPGSSPGVGAPAATPTTSPTLSPTASPAGSPSPSASKASVFEVYEGPLTPGRYRLRPLQGISPLTVEFTVPQGWAGFPDWAVLGPNGTAAPGGIGVGFLSADGLFSDPCHWDAKKDGSWPQSGDVTVGPTATDLANALLASRAYTATASADVTVDGYPAKRIDLQLPSNDLTKCDNAKGTTGGAYFVWGTKHPGGSDLFAQGPGQRWRLWIVDAEGARLVIVVNDFATTSVADRAAAQSIVDSVTIAP